MSGREQGNRICKLQANNSSSKQDIVAQKQNKEENCTKGVIKLIKEIENFVKETMDKKKSMLVYGLKKFKHIREKTEKAWPKALMKTVQEENLKEEIEEVYVLGRFEEG